MEIEKKEESIFMDACCKTKKKIDGMKKEEGAMN